jgi:hypothetical protein
MKGLALCLVFILGLSCLPACGPQMANCPGVMSTGTRIPKKQKRKPTSGLSDRKMVRHGY